MLLTLIYMAATVLRSWRLNAVYARLAAFIQEQTTTSIAFFSATPIGVNGGSTSDDTDDLTHPTATSDLCTNASKARIVDVIWNAPKRQGLVLTPKQHLQVDPWISFPVAPHLVPFEVQLRPALRLDEDQLVYALLEMGLSRVEQTANNVLMIEDFGVPIAWKVDSRIAVLLKTDLHRFAALIHRSFMQHNLVINDHLPLDRIESVEVTGEPQPFDAVRQYSRAHLAARSTHQLSVVQWDEHVTGMRDLNILASQASEFKYNRNRTEGKTGLVKPDLIPSAKAAPSPKRLTHESRQDSGVEMVNVIKTRVTPRKSPLRLIAEELPKAVEANSGEKGMSNKDVEHVRVVVLESETDGKSVDVTENIVHIVEKKEDVVPVVVNKLMSEEPTQEEKIIRKEPIAEMGSEKPLEVPPIAQQPPTPDAVPIAAHPVAPKKPVISSRSDGAARPTLVRSKGSLIASKPPNILVFSESPATRASVIATLNTILEEHMYTVYPLSATEVRNKIWIDNTTLLVVCGSVSHDIGAILTEFFLAGGKMLSLCSDVLHMVLPTFRAHAEVREHELVQFSYGRWHRVRMMHHIFCYQPSPVRKHFSTDSDEPVAATTTGATNSNSRSSSSLVCPRSVEVVDLQHKTHSLQVQVLGTEETWNTPSLMLATNASSGGKAVFSQVHLETDPNNYEHDEAKFAVLRQSDRVRIEIFNDLLSSYLGIVVRNLDAKLQPKMGYTNAYFLGDYKKKFEMLERIKPHMAEANTLRNPRLALRFCNHREQPPVATDALLPVLINSCPDNFSTIEYFDNLKSETIGRIAIYAPVMTTTTAVLDGVPLEHGLAVIARQQTAGKGRSNNQWLSPDGCLMFSVQLHIDLNTPLGKRLSLLQHLMAVAMVNAVLSVKGYESLNIRLKWPNDIYANGSTKIGGLVTTSTIEHQRAVCNVGCGVNLNNASPTVCINDLVRTHNTQTGATLAPLGYEQLLALTFTELERLYTAVQRPGGLQELYELYDRLWLHSDAEVTIVDANAVRRKSKIIGIDEYGFLLVQRPGEAPETVHPDGNSFDMLRGLIVPKAAL